MHYTYSSYRTPRGPDRYPRDYQRKKMYSWQKRYVRPLNNGIYSQHMTQGEIRDLVSRVYADYGMDVPHLIFNPRKSKSAAASYYNQHPKTWKPAIVFHPDGMTFGTTLHECAHGIKYKYPHEGEGGHGPMYMRMYIEIFAKYAGMERTELISTAYNSGLKIAPVPESLRSSISYPTVSTATEPPKFRKETHKLSIGTLTWTIPIN